MTQEKYTTGRRKFQHLTKEKRAQIEILLQQGLTKVQIAKMVGLACSTLYLELARSTVERLDSELRVCYKYFWDAGQRGYGSTSTKQLPASLKLAKAYAFVSHVETQMLEEKACSQYNLRRGTSKRTVQGNRMR